MNLYRNCHAQLHTVDSFTRLRPVLSGPYEMTFEILSYLDHFGYVVLV